MKKKDKIDAFKMVCYNCMDFDATNNTCTVRYLIHEDNSRTPMPRKPNQKGCEAFLRKELQ